MILPKNVLTLLHSLEIDLTPREKLQHTKHCQEIRIQPKISNIYCADLVCILFSYSVKFGAEVIIHQQKKFKFCAEFEVVSTV